MTALFTNNKELVGPWVFARVGGVWAPEGRSAIGLVNYERLVGGLVFENYTGRSALVHVALENAGYAARRFFEFASEYAYDQLGVQKLIAPVSSANHKAIRMNERIGFTLEATIRDVFVDGDMLLLTMTRDQCRYYPRNGGANV